MSKVYFPVDAPDRQAMYMECPVCSSQGFIIQTITVPVVRLQIICAQCDTWIKSEGLQEDMGVRNG